MSSSKPTLPEQVVRAIRAVAGAPPVMLHEPSFKGNEWLYLKECLDSTFVSSVNLSIVLNSTLPASMSLRVPGKIVA